MIVVVALSNAGLFNQVGLASRLGRNGNQVVILFSGERGALLPAFNRRLASADCDVVYLEDLVATTVPSNDPWHLPIAASKIDDVFSYDALHSFTALRQAYGKQINALKEFCELHKPTMAILGDDGIGTDPCVTSVLRNNGIRLLCVPYGYGGVEDLEHELDYKQATASYNYITTEAEGGNVVAEHYPHWVKSGRHAEALLLPPQMILARESLGVTLRHPWRTYGSEADLMCVPGQQYADHLILEGVPRDRIIVTGAPAGVQIHEVLQQDRDAERAFRQPAKLQPNQTRVLVSWPPSFHQTHGDRTEFPDSYASLTCAALQPLINHPNVRLTVTLHPGTLTKDRTIFNDLGIPLSESSIFNLIPRHDIFVTMGSSTTRWAIACGKPVLNYDFYKITLTAYRDAPGVLQIEKHQPYLDSLRRLIEDDAFFAATAEQQISVANDWGLINGLFFDELVTAPNQIKHRYNK